MRSSPGRAPVSHKVTVSKHTLYHMRDPQEPWWGAQALPDRATVTVNFSVTAVVKPSTHLFPTAPPLSEDSHGRLMQGPATTCNRKVLQITQWRSHRSVSLELADHSVEVPKSGGPTGCVSRACRSLSGSPKELQITPWKSHRAWLPHALPRLPYPQERDSHCRGC
jgi:hypothetical protein